MMRALVLLVVAACSPVDLVNADVTRAACSRWLECTDDGMTMAECVEDVGAWDRMIADCSALACDFDAVAGHACADGARERSCAEVRDPDAPYLQACEDVWYNCDMEIVNRCINDAVYGPG